MQKNQGVPSGLANALVIIADNTVHPAINATVPAVAAMGQSAVGLGHQLAIGRPRRGEVLVPFGEFDAEVEDLLFQLGGPAGEGFDVCRAPRPEASLAACPRASERRRSSRAMCADRRLLRAVRFATSASSDRWLTCVPAVVPGGGSVARARTAACRSSGRWIRLR
ncbi:hypothetical protein [Streptomyces sp. M1013]|uniref:hypothetical protein n=1 Tax=Streptomyces sp. M1013 TaxID=549798 RepID=UPI0015C5352B|nr:hypothetical protein [Streptomyces sp. M1013]